MALTFDDGPHPEGTPPILEALASAGARATFFVVGEQAVRYPGLVADLLAAGHEVGVHAHRHRNQMRLSPAAFAADLRRAVDAIGEISGRAPRWYRPPYGAFTLGGLIAVRRAGLRPLLWSRWGRDWDTRTSPERIAALATRDIGAGDVVLLHDADWYCSPGAHRHTAAALPAILNELGRRGLPAIPADPGA